MKIPTWKNLWILLALLLAPITGYSDPLDHVIDLSNFSNSKPFFEKEFQFENSSYVTAKYPDPYAFCLTVRTKSDTTPFLIMRSSKFGWNRFGVSAPGAPKCITIDLCILNEDLHPESLWEIIKLSLDNASLQYDYFHFKDEPLILHSNNPRLNTRFTSLLTYGDSYTEKMGCSPLNHKSSLWIYTYSQNSDQLMYMNAKTWASQYCCIYHIYKSLLDCEQTPAKEEFMNFLKECSDYLKTDSHSLIFDLYRKIMDFNGNKAEKKHLLETFNKYFLNYRNPLVRQITHEIFQSGLVSKNPLHRLLSYKVIKEALFIKEHIAKNIKLSTEKDEVIKAFKGLDLSKIYNECIQTSYDRLKKNAALPLEQLLLSSMNEEQITDLLTNQEFLLFSGFSGEEFARMLNCAMECVNVSQIDSYKEESQQSLQALLDKEFLWANRWKTYFSYNHTNHGEAYLKWFFCSKIIEDFDDFFIKESSN